MKPSKPAADVAVIGCGIVGLAAAFHLQQRGYSCLLIDAKGPGAEASFGNAGSVSVGNISPQSTPGIMWKGVRMLTDPMAPLKLDWPALPTYASWLLKFVAAGRQGRMVPLVDALHALNSRARAAWLEVGEHIDASNLLAPEGYLHVYSDPATLAQGEGNRRWMKERGVAFDVLDAQQLRELEPNLGPGFHHGVFQRDSLAVRDPGEFCQHLFDHLVRQGASSLTATVSAMRREGDAYRITTDRGDVHAAQVVVAAGAWTARLLRPFGIRIPLVPARGYHLMFPHSARALRRPTLWAERYIVLSPMVQGMRMTGMKELTALHRDPHPALIRRMAPEASKLLPGLEGNPVSEWAGHRPCTPDSLPVLDQVEDERIFVATGHGHLGLTQGPVSGKLIAQAMAGEDTDVPLHAYRLARF